MLVHHRLLHVCVHAYVHVYAHAYAHACAHGDVLPYVHDHDYAHDHVLHHNPSHHIFWYHDDRDDHDVYGRDRLCISIMSLPKMMWIDMTEIEVDREESRGVS